MLMAAARITYAIFGRKIFKNRQSVVVRFKWGDNLRSSQGTVTYANVQVSYTFTVAVTQILIEIKVDNFSTTCETTNISNPRIMAAPWLRRLFGDLSP
jgi:hypothetical protein